jgi:hypothetical protein
LGEFARAERERLALATKYTTLRREGDPNSAGGHRKNPRVGVEFTAAQLARLDEVSAFGLGVPHDFLTIDFGRAQTRGGMRVETRR